MSLQESLIDPLPDELSKELHQATFPSHLIGSYDLGLPGPRFVFVGGMHGNEPAGVLALREILRELESQQLPLRGRLVCFAGNLRALNAGQRYIDRDLNRIWGDEDIAAGVQTDVYETSARAALLEFINAEIQGAKDTVVFLDLHSTSADGSPFSIIGDTRQNRHIALALPVPVILGLEENVDGALLGYFGERGHVAIGYEGGQHDAPLTLSNHKAAVWLTLITAGGLTASETTQGKLSFERLREAGRGLPGVVEMRYRHQVDVRDEFKMRAGYKNFDRVEEDEWVASDGTGRILSKEKGLMLLPLYQGLGQDGFFIGREVRRFWLRVSSVLRGLKLGQLVHWMPGVQRVPECSETLAVDSRIARLWVVEIFHLLGFRRVRSAGKHLRFSRRTEGTPYNRPS